MRPKQIFQSIALLLLLISGFLTAQTNYAINKVPTCNVPNGTLTNITDNSRTSYVCLNNTTLPLIITIDLAAPFDITTIGVYWASVGASIPTSFIIKTSPDNITFTDYYTVSSRTSYVASDVPVISRSSVRYVQLYISTISPGGSVPICISEIEVWSNQTATNGLFNSVYSNGDLYVKKNATISSIYMSQTGSFGFVRARDGVLIPMISVTPNGSTSNLQIGSGSGEFNGGYTDIFGGASTKIRILSNGYVGIGTTTPTSLLTVNGAISATTGTDLILNGGNLTGNTPGSITIGGIHQGSPYPLGGDITLSVGKGYSSGQIYLKGNTTVTGLLNLTGSLTIPGILTAGVVSTNQITSSGALNVTAGIVAPKFTDLNNTLYYLDPASTTTSMIVAGNVGIGCTAPTVPLAVNGKIQATELELKSTPCADYVFEKSYKLMNLHDLENFVAANKHLPEVPSAEEYKTQGVNVSELNNLLLKKVEELTLYVIEQDKKIDAQNIQISRLQQEMEKR